jgi:HAD superfamily hydrolase (TIGR01509 family)
MRITGPIGAVILDMDGTLHDTEIAYYLALKRAVAGVGFEVSDHFCHSLIGIPAKECDLLLREHLGPEFPFAECDRLYVEHRDSLLAEGIPLKAGAMELLEFLAHERIPTAVATSASRRAAELHLSRSGLRGRLSVVVTRDDVTHGKPHPDLFLKAAHSLGAAPERCLAVEDSFNGIRAAHAAGMMALMVPDLVQPTPEIQAICAHIAVELREVQTIISSRWQTPKP